MLSAGHQQPNAFVEGPGARERELQNSTDIKVFFEMMESNVNGEKQY